MHDIFISYSSKDREWVARLAKALEAQGYEVWWDPEILPGQHYQDVIQKALHGAKSVIAVWTADSVQSDYVRAECLWAFGKRNLISVLGKDAEIPTPFNAIQAADLRKWKGSADDPQFQRLLRGIRFVQTGEIPQQPKVEPPEPKSRMGVVLAGVAAVAVAGSGVYWQQNGGFAGEDTSAVVEPAKPAVKPTAAPVESKPEVVLPPVAKAEAPKSYQLTVKTTPENAAITVDGNAYEAGKQWKPGTYTVKAVAEGYQPAEQTVTLKDQDAQVVIELNPVRLEYEPEMVSIPAGTFTMGCDGKRDDVEGGCSDDEKPAHKVTLKSFKLAKTETTVAQFRQFVEETGYKTTAETKGSCYSLDEKGSWSEVNGNSWSKLGFKQTDDDPVACVSWDDTQQYLEWLNGKAKPETPYRLPAEAEWEHAARGGKGGAYPWGQKGAEGCGYANMADQKAKEKFPDWTVADCNDGYIYTAPVGKLKPNGYGLYDMHGNVWEWVQGWYASDYYKSSPASSPQGSDSGTFRVLRGGSWSDIPRGVRSAFRRNLTPVYRDSDAGFRLAQDQ